MDIRLIAVLMAVAVVMDMLGRMAKKRAAEHQGEPAESQDVMAALSEMGYREKTLEPKASRLPQIERVDPYADPVSERIDPVPEPTMAAPTVDSAPARDRSPRPVVVRSRTPRPVEPRQAPVTADAARVPEVRPDIARAVELPPPPTIRGRTQARRQDIQLGLGTPKGLKQAVVAREVLGPPLSLRRDGESR